MNFEGLSKIKSIVEGTYSSRKRRIELKREKYFYQFFLQCLRNVLSRPNPERKPYNISIKPVKQGEKKVKCSISSSEFNWNSLKFLSKFWSFRSYDFLSWTFSFQSFGLQKGYFRPGVHLFRTVLYMSNAWNSNMQEHLIPVANFITQQYENIGCQTWVTWSWIQYKQTWLKMSNKRLAMHFR